MITIEKPFDFNINYDLSHIGDINRLVFFDIETTGFSPSTSSLYLIGAVSYESGGWVLRQWFASSWSEEKDILNAFFSFLKPGQILIHFNGDGFDIPYLTKCARQYHIEPPFEMLESFDILKKIRAHRKLLQMESMRQKAVEQFLNVAREDIYSGGDLIPIYHSYEKQPNEQQLQLLLLHNEDDLKGMPQILPILTYHDFIYDDFKISEYYRSKSASHLFITARFPYSFPVQLLYTLNSNIQIALHENSVICKIPMAYGSFRFYYPDYKNYYYLPAEDCAIHKKLASFVDKEHRVCANASNCYTKIEGLYLPCLDTALAPALYPGKKCGSGFQKYEDTEEFRYKYFKAILSNC